MPINRQVDINFFESAFIPTVRDSSTGHTYSKTSGNFLPILSLLLISVLNWTCEMLQCGSQLLQDALTRRTVEAGNEKVVTPLTSARVSFHAYH